MRLARLAFAAVPPVAAAAIGGLSTLNAQEVYGRLDKPSWAPPAKAFGPVWSALYAMVGVAGWRMEPVASETTKRLHLAQLAVNAAWSPAFFRLRSKPASLAVIAALDALVVAEILRLRREEPVSATLLLPYLSWSGYATALTAAVSDPARA